MSSLGGGCLGEEIQHTEGLGRDRFQSQQLSPGQLALMRENRQLFTKHVGIVLNYIERLLFSVEMLAEKAFEFQVYCSERLPTSSSEVASKLAWSYQRLSDIYSVQLRNFEGEENLFRAQISFKAQCASFVFLSKIQAKIEEIGNKLQKQSIKLLLVSILENLVNDRYKAIDHTVISMLKADGILR